MTEKHTPAITTISDLAAGIRLCFDQPDQPETDEDCSAAVDRGLEKLAEMAETPSRNLAEALAKFVTYRYRVVEHLEASDEADAAVLDSAIADLQRLIAEEHGAER